MLSDSEVDAAMSGREPLLTLAFLAAWRETKVDIRENPDAPRTKQGLRDQIGIRKWVPVASSQSDQIRSDTLL